MRLQELILEHARDRRLDRGHHVAAAHARRVEDHVAEIAEYLGEEVHREAVVVAPERIVIVALDAVEANETVA